MCRNSNKCGIEIKKVHKIDYCEQETMKEDHMENDNPVWFATAGKSKFITFHGHVSYFTNYLFFRTENSGKVLLYKNMVH